MTDSFNDTDTTVPPVGPPPPIVTVSYGIETTPVPDGGSGVDEWGFITDPLVWRTVQMNLLTGYVELNGFRLNTKFYRETTTTTTSPDTGEVSITKTREYLPFVLTNQTLTITSHEDGDVFTTTEGTEIFVAPPGPYEVAVSGITDGSRYDYFKVFDETELHWLPRSSSIKQDYIINKALPTEPPVDDVRARPKLSLDSVSNFKPDTRLSVDIVYELVTEIQTTSGAYSATQIITHTVTQPDEAWDKILELILNRCYFVKGYYHVSLYDDGYPEMYTSEGIQLGATHVKVFDVDGNHVTTQSYNARGIYRGEVKEPIYPIIADAEATLRNGEVVDITISNRGAFYPGNFYVEFNRINYTDGGRIPVAIAHVTPITRDEGREVTLQDDDGNSYVEYRLGSLRGGEIERIEIVDGGSMLLSPPEIDLDSFELSNTVINYGTDFSHTKPREQKLAQETRTPND